MLLADAIAPTLRSDVTWTPLDDRWYTDDLGLGFSMDPLWIGPDTIYLCDVVLAAVRFLADAYSVCPPQVFRRVGDNKRQPEPRHYAQRVLRNPNAWQTGFEWRSINTVWTSTWGNSYNLVVSGGVSFAQELRPVHPSRMRVVDQADDGSLLYEYSPKRGPKEILSQDQVLHFRGISFDGLQGAKIYTLIRNAVLIALAAQRHVLTYMRKGTRLAGLLIPKQPIDDEQRGSVGKAWNEAFGGPDSTGTVGVMPFDFEFKPMAADSQKGQVLELSNLPVESVLRSLGVPGVVVGYQGDKASTYASADAFFEKGGIKHCVLPRIVAAEQREEKLLLPDDGDLLIKHNMDALLRANTKDRFAALLQATGRPFMTGNEARAIEDLNALDDEDMDRVALPSNMTGDQASTDPPPPEPPPGPKPKKKAPPPVDDDSTDAQAPFIRDAAARMVRREQAAIRDRLSLLERDPAAFERWLASYYERHAGAVEETMHVTAAAARAYADRQRKAVLAAGGLAGVESWTETGIPELELVALAIEHQEG